MSGNLNQRKTRWMLVSLTAGVLLSLGALRWAWRAQWEVMVIYAALAFIFFLAALGYHTGRLK